MAETLRGRVEAAIDRLPRIRLGHFPTPIAEARNLSHHLAGPRILIKRDDLTGFGFGGTKCRMLEYHVGLAKEQGYDTLVLYASAQSNYCSQLAAAARRMGMKAVLLLDGGPDEEIQGNLLLDRLLGAEVRYKHIENPYSDEGIKAFDELHAGVLREFEGRGHKPFIIDRRHRPSPLSVVGAMTCGFELADQLATRDLKVDQVFVTVGSGATYAGLLLAVKACGLATEVVGIASAPNRPNRASVIRDQATEAITLLGVEMHIDTQEIVVHEQYAGLGYGIPTDEGNRSIILLAQTEGIFLDPVYTAKGMSGLADRIAAGEITRGQTVVFLHTGGGPSVFAHNAELAEAVLRWERSCGVTSALATDA
jgi:L-cysteate sulfo-lyase